MIHSMTAFARRESALDAGTLSWELRSLNHRYLEVALRLPEELRALETAAREHVNARLARGKLDCTCRFQPAARSAVPVAPRPQISTRTTTFWLTICRASPREIRPRRNIFSAIARFSIEPKKLSPSSSGSRMPKR